MSCETQLIESINKWIQILDHGSGQADAIVLEFVLLRTWEGASLTIIKTLVSTSVQGFK